MKQTRNEGCPRKNCPARVRKIVMRNPHWRERVVAVVPHFATGEPTEIWASEPVIILRPKRHARLLAEGKIK